MKAKFLLFLLPIIMITSVLANGLQVVNNGTISVNKIVGTTSTQTISLQNQEAYSFYNIFFDHPEIINPVNITEIASGQTTTVTFTISGNDNYEGPIKIKGYYQARVGASNSSTSINVDFSNGLSKCDFTIVKGDKVTWTSNVDDTITLHNEETGNDVTTVSNLNNYTSNFDTPTTFKYSFFRRGYRFTDICTITAISDTGLVNDPILDTSFNFSLSNTFNPTNISVNLVDTNFTMDFFDTQQGIMTIRNTGNNTAQNITLKNDWMTFSRNNFNLNSGTQVALVFTISPIVLSTNDTGKSYSKQITITGNFPSTTENVSVFINHAEITNSTGNNQSLVSAFQQFCQQNPSYCNLNAQKQYIYIGNASDQEVAVNMTLDQVRAWMAYQFEVGDSVKTAMNYIKTSNDLSNQTDQNTSEDIRSIKSDIGIWKEEVKQSSDNINFAIYTIIIIFALGAAALSVFVAYKYKQAKEF